MNRVHKIVWNEVTRAFVAVGEHVRGRGKRSGSGAAGVASPAAAKPAGLNRPRPMLLALEARLMFDGALPVEAARAAHATDAVHAADGADAAHAPAANKSVEPAAIAAAPVIAPAAAPAIAAEVAPTITAASAPNLTPAAADTGIHKILFIDSRLPDYQKIAGAAQPDVKVVVLASDTDGLHQMADALRGTHDLDSISIVSHGAEGVLLVGSAALHSGDISQYASELTAIGAALKPHGEILLYGCDVGAGSVGRSFIDSVAGATGAVVAASIDTTGGVAEGGNWNLEIATGTLSSAPVLQTQKLADYDYSLATFSVANVTDLRATLTTINTNGADDTITLTGDVTFTLSSDTISLTESGHSVTIVGAGHTISAANLTQAMRISSGVTADLQNLTIANGFITGNGGNAPSSGAVAGGDALGAGIRNAGTLSISGVTFSGNKAAGGGGGAAGPGGQSGGGGGGGGFGSTVGGTGGSNDGYSAGSRSAGTGGHGAGTFSDTGIGGAGGSSGGTNNGGAAGVLPGGSTGGSGGNANAGGGISIGGGGGGGGNYAAGARGGNAAAAIYNTGGTITIASSTFINNIAAGGGGGGGSVYAMFPGNGGAGGSGVAGIWNASGTVRADSATQSSITGASNVGGGGAGGYAHGGGGTPGAAGSSVKTLGTITTFVPSPTVSGVTASTANGAYKAGDTLDIQVGFSEAVTVTGTPQLTLETGSIDRVVNYASGSGTSTLTFSYTVQAGDTSADLDYLSSTALALNGGTIRNASAYDATLTLAAPGAANSLGANKALVIDTTAPSSPATPDMSSASDNGGSNTDNITSLTTPTFTGTAEASATVRLYDSDGSTVLGTTTADGSGNWSITASSLSVGAHSVSAKATDAAGNTGTASSSLAINIVDPASTTITSASYDAGTGVLAVTGTNLLAGDSIDPSKLTLTGQVGSTYTLTSGSVSASSGTAFSITLNAADKLAIGGLLNTNGTSSVDGTTFNLAAAANWDATIGASADLSGNAVTASNVTAPTIASATYDASTHVLSVTGSHFVGVPGAGNDITPSRLTLAGEGGSSYTLTSGNVEVSSATQFSVTLNATDQAGVATFLNKNGSTSTSGTGYTLSAADDWNGVVTGGDILDSGNGVTVSNVAVPTITSATYDASTGTLVVIGTGLLSKAGAANDIDLSKLMIKGEGSTAARYTLTGPSVDISSSTDFSVTLNAADRAGVNMILGKNGASSTSGTTYVINANEDWAAGADAAVVVADSIGNGITVSNVAVPRITSATYDVTTGVLTVTGSDFVKRSGPTNDIDVTKLTLSGDGAAYTLTGSTANVEITSPTRFTVTLGSTDKAAVATRLNKNGSSSQTSITYNLAGAEDWAGGADAAVIVADLAGNGITVTGNNSAPVIAGLDGDSVALSGTVALDSGVALSVSDAENDAGNWNGSTLVVQRVKAGGVADASANDVFGFAAAGIVDTGAALTDGSGNVIATYAQSGGVLTVTFTGSGTSATNALVQSVMNGVRYSNATPYGNTTLRFALSDGSGGSTSADVTVTSSTIHVTQLADDGDGDAADGFSLREALARSAAQAGADTVVLDNLTTGTTLTLSGSTATLGAGDTLRALGSHHDLTIAGSGGGGLVLAGASTVSVGNSSALSLSADISGSGSLTKNQGYGLTLSGTNTYSGGTTVTNGWLTLNGAGALPGTGALTVNASGANGPGHGLILGADLSVGSLAGSGTVDLGSHRLTAGGGNGSTTFDGVIDGSGGLTKAGSGTMTLSGANNYTGATIVGSGGTLALDGGAALADGSALSVAGTLSLGAAETIGSLAGTGTVALNSFALTAGADNTSTAFSGTIAGAGTLAKTGSGSLTLSGAGNGAQGWNTMISAGTLSIATHVNLGSGSVTLDGGTLAATGHGTSPLGTAFMDEMPNAVVIGSSGGTIDVTAMATSSSQLALKGALTGSGTLTVVGGISGANIWNANGFAGNIVVSSGFVEAYGSSDLGSGTLTMNAGTILWVSGDTRTIRSNIVLAGNAELHTDAATYLMAAGAAITFSGAISESGGARSLTLANDDPGNGNSIVLSGNNSYTGTTTISGTSTVVAASDNALGSSSGSTTVANGSSLAFSGGITVAEALTIGSTGVSNAGALQNLGGDNTLTGTVTLATGALVGVSAGGLTLSGNVSGSAPLTKSGSGSLTLAGTSNSFTGATNVLAGTLNVSGTVAGTSVTVASGSSLNVTGTLGGSGTVTVASGATLSGTGSIGKAVSVSAGGALAPGVAGINHGVGRLTLSGGLALASGSLLAVDIDGTSAGSGHDQVAVTGAVSLNGATLAATLGYNPATGDSYVLIDNDASDAITGSFSGLAQGSTLTLGSNSLAVSYAGGTGNEMTLTMLDTVAPNPPGPPDLASGSDRGFSNSDDLTSTATPTFTGTAEGGATVSLYDTDGTTVLGTGTADGSGNWSITSTTLSSGVHTVTAKATDAANNVSPASAGLSLTIDTTAPTVAITSDSSALKIGETATVTFTFSEDPGASFAWNGSAGDVVVTGGTLGAISGSGPTRTATFTPTAAVNAGTASITVAAGNYTDAAGNNGGAGATPSISFDTLAPNAPGAPDLGAGSDSGSSSSDDITRIGTPTFSGTVEANATVRLLDSDGVTLLGSTTADGAGDWSITSSALSDGVHLVSATATDAAGNTSPVSSALALRIDTTAPALPSAPALSAASDSGESNSDSITNVATPTFAITTEAFAHVRLFDTGGTIVIGSGTADASGHVDITSSALGAGLHDITLEATDAAGNVSAASPPLSVTIDSTGPALASSITLTDSALKAGDTATVSFTFTEAVRGFTTADLTVENGTVSGLSSSDGGITWTGTLTPAAGVADPNNTITLDNTGITDLAGNAGAGTSASGHYAVDTARPALASAIGISDTALAIGDTATVTFAFTEAVTGFSIADITVPHGTLSNLSSGDGGVTWTATLTASAGTSAASNAITLDLTGVTDSFGNAGSGSGSSGNYAVDTVRPTLASGITISDAALKTGDTATVTISFTEAVTGLSVADLSVPNGSLSGLSSSDGGLTWTATLTPDADSTAPSNVVTLDLGGISDLAGNAGSGSETSSHYAVDTAAPALASTIALSKTALKSGETATVTVSFTEAVTGFTTADLSAASGVISNLSSSDGGITWTATLMPDAGVESNGNVVTLDLAGVSDLAGNSGQGSARSGHYAIDTTAPALASPIAISDTALKIGDTATVTFSFTEAVTGFSTADVTVPHGTLSNLSSSDGGTTWTATLTPDAGTSAAGNTLALDLGGIADLAGNTGSGSIASGHYGVNTQAPTLAITSDTHTLKLGETATVTFTFSEDPGNSFEWDGSTGDVAVSGGTLGALTGTGLTRSAIFTPAAGLEGGSASVTVAGSSYADLAGNPGSAGAMPSISIDTTRPTASIVVADDALAAGESSLVTIRFSEAVGGFDNSDLTVANGNLTAVSSTDGGRTWTATYTPRDGLSATNNVITLDNSGVSDAAGNRGAGTTDSNRYAIDTAILVVPPPMAAPAPAAPEPERVTNTAAVMLSPLDPALASATGLVGETARGNSPPSIGPSGVSLGSGDAAAGAPVFSFDAPPTSLDAGRPPGGDRWSLASASLAPSESGLTRTAPSAFQIAVVPLEQPGLQLFHALPDQGIERSQGQFSFTIPADTFAHSDAEAVIRLSATRSDGRPLPDWLRFDATTGRFTGNPPADLGSAVISITVTARDAQGHQAATVLRIRPDDKGAEPAIRPQPRSLRDDAGLPGKHGVRAQAAAAGRTGLSEQIRSAGRHPAATRGAT